eukprot:Skav233870  [mRNA]  locus=scaffold1483:116502:118567:+ [translate_table: standard]
MVALIFDIRHKERDMVPSLISPCAVTSKDEGTGPVWDYLDGGIVLDPTKVEEQSGKGSEVQVLLDSVELSTRLKSFAKQRPETPRSWATQASLAPGQQRQQRSPDHWE